MQFSAYHAVYVCSSENESQWNIAAICAAVVLIWFGSFAKNTYKHIRNIHCVWFVHNVRQSTIDCKHDWGASAGGVSGCACLFSNRIKSAVSSHCAHANNKLSGHCNTIFFLLNVLRLHVHDFLERFIAYALRSAAHRHPLARTAICQSSPVPRRAWPPAVRHGSGTCINLSDNVGVCVDGSLWVF